VKYRFEIGSGIVERRCGGGLGQIKWAASGWGVQIRCIHIPITPLDPDLWQKFSRSAHQVQHDTSTLRRGAMLE
jgi:hypothetical protein